MQEFLGWCLTISIIVIIIDSRGEGVYVERNELIRKAVSCLVVIRTADIVVGDAAARCLAESLQGNTKVRGLHLIDAELSDSGGRALAKSLCRNEVLTSIDLTNNQIGDATAQAFASAILKNRSLRSLDLTNNRIGDKGVLALAKALEESRDNFVIHLGGNVFGTAAIEALESLHATKPDIEISGVNLGKRSAADDGLKSESHAKELSRRRSQDSHRGGNNPGLG